MSRIITAPPVVLADNDDPEVLVDDSSWASAQRTTRSNLLAVETNARTNADNDIIDGAGLDADGSFSPLAGSNYLEAADFVSEGLNENIRNGLKIIDLRLGEVVNTLDVTVQATLSSAEILAINSAPPVKYTALGANRAYHCKELIFRNNFNTVAYATAGANGFYLQFNGGDQAAHILKAYCEAASTEIWKVLIMEHELSINTALECYGPDGDFTLGDGTYDLFLTYSIFDNAGGPAAVPLCCTPSVAGTFTAADLSAAGNLAIHHQLNTVNVTVFILDNNNVSNAVSFQLGDLTGLDIQNYVNVPIGPGIPGTWRYFVVAKQ